ncbi:HNH endonuclease [Promicromonospora sp. NPDC019610]|uniref:HNH endonuclease n=1 Tax=Promicromonospora sp. NPDC019610 TaxID=3364405 RepID=UPI003790E5DA
MGKQETGGGGGWATSLKDRKPGGMLTREGVPVGPDGDPRAIPPGGLALPMAADDDPAAGTMPDDAWLAGLFAEGDALFGDGGHRRVPDIPDGRDSYGRASDGLASDGWVPDGWVPDGWVSGSAASGGRAALWPDESLRRALGGAPGAELAWVVAASTGIGAASSDGEDGGSAGALPAGCAAIGDGSGRLVGLSGDVLAEQPGDASAEQPGDASAEQPGDALAELSDDALADLMSACARLQSWAAGVQALAVAERAARETSPLAHSSLVGQVTAELVITQAEGPEVVVRAESGAEHPTVIAALVQGRIDVRKAHTLLRSAADLTVAERGEAITRYLPQAPYRTWRWLRNKLLAFAKARHGAEETARAAAEHRNVQIDRSDNDMGWVSAYLPAVDAAAVWGVVDDLAHQLRYTAGEERTLGQLRADCLTGIVTGRLLPGDRFTVNTQAGGSTEANVTPTTSTTDTNMSADGATPVCGCGGREPEAQETVVRVTPTRPVVRVTVPASALLGLDDAPGELDGFGPIPAETARLIAQDATWQRLVTDPVTGVLVDYSSQAYTPGKVLRSAVEARDGTCTFVGCDTPATTCDLDHIEPFDHEWRERAGAAGKNQPGQTNASNLHALCRRHHLLKTHAGWGVERDAVTGITTWTTPAGSTHARPPTILDTRVDLDRADPGTSQDSTLRALTGRRLPRAYGTAGPAADAIEPSAPGVPPF